MPQFEALNPQSIISLSHKLAKRVSERFPDRGLTKAAENLAYNAIRITEEAESLSSRSIILPLLIGVSFILGIVGLLSIVRIVKQSTRLPTIDIEAKSDFFQAIQGVDAGIHIIVLTGLAMLFFVNYEARVKRRKALRGLQKLRAYAHVVDMHQLNKDPAAIAAALPRTLSSPERDLTPQELLRYLDYCSEMLSIISKFAALYSHYSGDSIVIDTVNDVEQLTASLSNKIWQKIMIIHSSLGKDISLSPIHADFYRIAP